MNNDSRTQAINILKHARALIAKGWCQGSYAKDINEHRCHSLSDKAAYFCSIGALNRSSRDLDVPFPTFAIGDAENILSDYMGNVTNYNDTHNKTEVLALFDKAIANG